MQVEGLHVTPLMPSTEANDRQMFARTIWRAYETDLSLIYNDTGVPDSHLVLDLIVERIYLFYLPSLSIWSATSILRPQAQYLGLGGWHCVFNPTRYASASEKGVAG